jgi:hypothetical protein
MNITIHPTAPKYTSKAGNEVFRYIVKGSLEEIADFKKVKAPFFADKQCAVDKVTGEPLFFSTTELVGEIPLRKGKTKKNEDDYVIDVTEGQMFMSLVKQYGVEYAEFKMKKQPVKAAVIEGQK